MAVYVDNARNRLGRMKMCHMWADSLEELLAMADAIGVQRKWIQGHAELSFGIHRKASWLHFDISVSKRKLAIDHGAIATDRYGPLEHVARIRGNVELLTRIEELRTRKLDILSKIK